MNPTDVGLRGGKHTESVRIPRLLKNACHYCETEEEILLAEL